jgi:TonB family protein
MSASWWLGNLASYSIQVMLVVAVGGLAAAALRLRQPRVMLAYWQALLAACLLLPLLEPWQHVGLAPAGSVATAVSIRTGGADKLVSLVPIQAWAVLLLAGVGVGLLRLVLGIWRLNHYRCAALRIAPLPDTLRDAQALVGVQPTFYFSDRVQLPVTFGWLDPAIIFPRRFARLDESHQRAIACHELLHVARRDWLVNLFEELVLTFFWFHPAIWWAVHNIRLSREQVVDCEVVALTGARKPYLHALLEIGGMPRAMSLPAPLFLVENQLAKRVASLVKEVRMSKPRLVTSLVIALAVVAGTGWWGIRRFYLQAPTASLPTGVGEVYGFASAPGAEGSSAFMLYMVKDDGRAGFGVRTVDGAQIKGPVPISMPAPPYTPQAKKDKVQGAIVAAVDVDASGNVAGVKLTAVSLSRDLTDGLDESVLQALPTWKFKPAMKKGEPVPVKVTVHVVFNLS